MIKQVNWPSLRRESHGSATAKRPEFVAVVDPGSSLLRVLVVRTGEGLPVATGWGQRAARDRAGAGQESLANDLESALAQAEEMAQGQEERWRAPDQIVVGLPASQVRGGSWPVVQRRSRPSRPIGEREFEALLGRALRLSMTRLMEDDARGWLLIDAVPVALSVDGKGVTDPVGFRAEEMGASVFAALGQAETVDSWRAAAEKLRFGALTLTATPLALALCLSQPQGIVVDVGCTATDLTWWRAARPVCLGSFPVGGQALTELLLRKWGLTVDRAETLKLAYAAGRLTSQARAQVQDVLSPALRAWLDLLEATLHAMSEKVDEPLPHQIYICGGGSALQEVTEAAKTLARSRRLVFDRYPEVQRLYPTDVPGVVNRTNAGRLPGDVPAMALAAWVGRHDEAQSRPARMLRRLCED